MAQRSARVLFVLQADKIKFNSPSYQCRLTQYNSRVYSTSVTQFTTDKLALASAATISTGCATSFFQKSTSMQPVLLDFPPTASLGRLDSAKPFFAAEFELILYGPPPDYKRYPRGGQTPSKETAVLDRSAILHARGSPVIYKVLRTQFECCQTSKEILRVIAVALQRDATIKVIWHLHQSIIRACFRARSYESDRRICGTIRSIISRLQIMMEPVHPELFKAGLKFAARSRSITLMKRFLWDFRTVPGLQVTQRVFRSVIAKCSIGRHGFGEYRNGRWNRRDLLSVLLGFPGTLSGSPKGSELDHHLGSFLDRGKWPSFHGWLQILSRCKANNEIWKEWEYWRNSKSRTDSAPVRHVKAHHHSCPETVQQRGDAWFICHMLVADDPAAAWRVLVDSKIDFWSLTKEMRSRLFDDIEHAAAWDGNIKDALLDKCCHDLEIIENKLGVRWVSDGGDDGYHVVLDDLETRLERLASPTFFHIPGFFSDESAKQVP